MDTIHAEGFWSEFFLLKPDRASLQRRFENLGSDDLLHFQVLVHELLHNSYTESWYRMRLNSFLDEQPVRSSLPKLLPMNMRLM